jgi:valine--pyruvate aminotransferase
MNLSKFGQKFCEGSGINHLMEDLGNALSGSRDMLMLGGGNPSHIPEVQSRIRRSLERLLDRPGEFERAIGDYDVPQGNTEFIGALAALLRAEYGWDIGPENVALTAGSQSAFFTLFNMFAGEFSDGSFKRVLLPLIPEYIGYADVGLSENFFAAAKPEIEHLDGSVFKYRIDFDAVAGIEDIGAICVSRPTNPTGNVLTDNEIQKLSALAKSKGIPLIIDNAYGAPFPNIIFREANLLWDEHIVLCMSLSKFGLPTLRTGIVVARKEIIDAVAKTTAVMSLAPARFGAALACEMVKSGEILSLSRETIRPFYEEKARSAVEQLKSELDGIDWHVHSPEGAMFLWLWFRDMPISCQELYERVKSRGALVVPGHYFFPGLSEQWKHKNECIRVTYSQAPEAVRAGLRIIAEEAKKAYV